MMDMTWHAMPQQQNRTFSEDRCNFAEHGKTGLPMKLYYNGQGAAGEGGNTKAQCVDNNFVTASSIKAAVKMREQGITAANAGLPVEFQANNGVIHDVLYTHTDGSLRCRGGGWRLGTP